MKCPLCKETISVATPYFLKDGRIVECCFACSEEFNLKVAQLPEWKRADVGVLQ